MEKLEFNKKYFYTTYRFIIAVLIAAFFSLFAFPNQIGIGLTDKEVDLSSGQKSERIDFFDEAEILKLKSHIQRAKTYHKDLPALSKAVLEAKYIRYGSNKNKSVAITFDDGPNFLSPKYLQVLQDYNVPATFFLIGVHVEKYPKEAEMLINSNHEIGIHSYAHKQMTKMNVNSLNNDFQKTFAVIRNIGDANIRYFRPPFGEFNDEVLKAAKKYNLISVLWSVDPRDWQVDDPNLIAQHVVEKAENGSIILLHEGRQSTLNALPSIIKGLRKKGFDIVSLSKLLSTYE